jgi:hypothetical protein
VILKVEYAHQRKIRERNKTWYRVAHMPIWIWVFFLAPGPLTFELFAQGPSGRNGVWLLCVLSGVAVAAHFGQLPGCEPRPYILRFCEDKPNPLYRRICYTFAWNALLNFAFLNLLGLFGAIFTGKWYLGQIYSYGYFPILLLILALSVFGVLPRARSSTKGEGWERRYFYGAVWSVTAAQFVLLVLWKSPPRGFSGDLTKLTIYVLTLIAFGTAAAVGFLPRTRPILPGEFMVAD